MRNTPEHESRENFTCLVLETEIVVKVVCSELSLTRLPTLNLNFLLFFLFFGGFLFGWGFFLVLFFFLCSGYVCCRAWDFKFSPCSWVN